VKVSNSGLEGCAVAMVLLPSKLSERAKRIMSEIENPPGLR
jgi:hypothetical protein